MAKSKTRKPAVLAPSALDDGQREVENLRRRLRDLEAENEISDGLDLADRVRDQLDSLCVAIESGRTSVPQTPEQWRRCLQGIANGEDWENGTWR